MATVTTVLVQRTAEISGCRMLPKWGMGNGEWGIEMGNWSNDPVLNKTDCIHGLTNLNKTNSCITLMYGKQC